MSALDFAARALALQAAAQRPLTFTELAAADLPESITRIESHGYAAPGLGAASYVSDSKADGELMAAHPAAMFAGAGDRLFRLTGDADGFITPEQMGCPTYAPGTNQQPFIQAAIDYALAAGLNGVRFTQSNYELWCPLRTAEFSLNTDHSGCFMVVSGQLTLESSHPLRSQLNCKGPGGGSLASDYQVMDTIAYGNDVIWRGHGIKITGTVSVGSPQVPVRDLAMVRIRNLILFSDAVGVQNTDWPALAPSRDPSRENSWDISNKGVYFQQDKQAGIVHAENLDIIGFLGECVFSSGQGKGGFVGRNLVLKHTNGQALNANGPEIFDVDGLYAENCAFSIEGWGGQTRGKIVNATFVKSKTGGVSGGTAWTSPRRDDGSLPMLYIEATLQDCGDFYPGSYLSGKLTLIDTQLAVVLVHSAQVIRDVDLDITTICDKRADIIAVRFAPFPTSAARSIENVNIRLHGMATAEARTAGRGIGSLLSQTGSLGPNNFVRASGQFKKIGVVSGGPLPDFYVSIIDSGFELTDLGGPVFFAPATTPTPDIGVGWIRPSFSGASGLFTMNLPANVNQHNDGAMVTIEHRDTTSVNAVLDVGGVALLGFRDRLRLRADKIHNRWRVMEAPLPRAATGSVTIPATALDAQAGPFTLALLGTRAWHQPLVTPVTALAGYIVSAVRAETDQIRFWLRNIDGANPAAEVAVTFRASVKIAS
ncbi:hypothetical protein [Allopontixanthobacter sp.]|uniref:hypothetical protein n=1 Tax=Allopontixanthobacter sp. TaxID=2906452 RepID=UPI002AB8E402|nr:hypothetical protein [Allopontixanthobacter sp.]MDZ4307487.1 hypothetical protein [Allopontixanthobacter sp.]